MLLTPSLAPITLSAVSRSRATRSLVAARYAVALMLAGLSATFACAVDTVVCWGYNAYGQGNVPANLGIVSSVAAGDRHTVALRSNGTLACWGDNSLGQCTVPAGMGVVTAVDAGPDFTVALRSDGLVSCWGDNEAGQCYAPGLSNVIAIAVGWRSSIALRSNGTVYRWGQLYFSSLDVPLDLGFVTKIGAGSSFFMAIDSTQTVRCWGFNSYGQLNVPPGLAPSQAVAGGDAHSVALGTDGAVRCWGGNDKGQCNVPAGLGGVTAIAAAGLNTIALEVGGQVVCWGWNELGQTDVPAGLAARVIAASSFSAVALGTADGDECHNALDASIGANSVNVESMTPSLFSPGSTDCAALGWNATQKDAWFVYDAPTVGFLSLDFCASTYDTSVVLYIGSCGGLIPIACDDDSCPQAGYRSRISSQMVAPGEVYIRIGGYLGAAATASFNLSFAQGDECATATPAVAGTNIANTGFLTSSANQPADEECTYLDWGNSRDAWFVFDAPIGGFLTTSFCNSNYDTSVVFYQGACGSLNRIACDDDSCGESMHYASSLSVMVEEGPVYIRIGGYLGASGLAEFELDFEPNLQGDHCVDAIVLSPGMQSVNTALMTPSPNAPADQECLELNWNNSKDAWFEYHNASPAYLSLDFCDSNYDTSVVLYSGSSCADLTRIGCGDDECGAASNYRTHIVDQYIDGPITYIRIGGYEGATGTANFTWSVKNPGDECSTARPVLPGVNSVFVQNFTASNDPIGTADCTTLGWNFGQKDVWYVYTAPSAGFISADFCDSDYDTSVVLYQGVCGALTTIGCGDDECSPKGPGFQSRIINQAVAAGPVYIRIGGWHGAVGEAEFTVFFGAPCLGDLDNNGVVGAPDLARLLSGWGGSGSADLDGNGDVGAPDLAIMLSAWGPCS